MMRFRFRFTLWVRVRYLTGKHKERRKINGLRREVQYLYERVC